MHVSKDNDRPCIVISASKNHTHNSKSVDLIECNLTDIGNEETHRENTNIKSTHLSEVYKNSLN